MTTTVTIEDLRVACQIGCMRHERHREQAVRVDLQVRLDAHAAADGEDLGLTWDYARGAEQIAFVLRAGRFLLLETAARALVRLALLPPAPGQRCPRATHAEVKLTKYGVLPGEALAIVSTSSSADALSFTRESTEWGSVDVIDRNRRVGLYRLNVTPGQEISTHAHTGLREAELVLNHGLVGWTTESPPTPLPPGTSNHWAKNQPHGYRNVSRRVACLLCLDAPPFDRAEEQLLPEDLMDLASAELARS